MAKLFAILGVLLVIAGGTFWWQSQSGTATTGTAAATPAPAPEVAAPIASASPTQELALTEEAIDALATENAELEARIADLEAQNADAEKLIALKTARLQALEKTQSAQ